MDKALVAVWAMLLICCAGCSGGTATGPVPGTASPVPAPASVLAAATSAASQPAGQAFTSTEYGYSAMIPAGTEIAAATSGWDGGDIDHTAAYADRFYGTDGVTFVVGTPTDLPLAGLVDEHVAWLTANRGCPAPSSRADTEVDGVPAVRLAFHCPNGIYGPTLVEKAIAVRDGKGVIFTSMSPDAGAEELAAFDKLLDSVRWTSP
jgi:hypothetical protein